MDFEKSKRLESVRVVIDDMLKTMNDAEERRCAYLHLYGVSQTATILALKRGLDPELGAIAGMFHDYYSYKTGFNELHDQNTAEVVRPILRDMGIFSKEEQRLILSSIFHHSDKTNHHGPYDELIKDADVLQHYLYNIHKKVGIKKVGRLKGILKELCLPHVLEIADDLGNNQKDDIQEKNKLMADIAQTLAAKGIIGIPGDEDYRKICRYWPGDNTYKDLKAGWCAAFVYYCSRKAGFLLPIRYPNGIGRFAGVDAWLEWAQMRDTKFFHGTNEVDFTPQRGDIIIYDRLITDHGHDHMGVVLSCDEGILLVAEGNVDNNNKSGIVTRDRWKKVLGYIRVDNRYQYNFNGEYVPQLD